MTFSKAFAEVSLTKESTSSGVGGRPVRSKVARRIRVRLSASATGFRLLFSSSRKDEAVNGVRTQALFMTCGTGGFLTG